MRVTWKGWGIRLVQGELTQWISSIRSRSVDLIFCNPPKMEIKREYKKRSHLWLSHCIRILKDTGGIYIMCGQRDVWFFQEYLERKKFKFRNMIIWCITSAEETDSFCISYVPILYYTKSDKFIFHEDKLTDRWEDVFFQPEECLEGEIFEKSRQVPLGLIERVLKSSTDEGSIVLDTFMGVGSIGMQCIRLGRNYVGVEKDQVLFEKAKERIDGEMKLFPDKNQLTLT